MSVIDDILSEIHRIKMKAAGEGRRADIAIYADNYTFNMILTERKEGHHGLHPVISMEPRGPVFTFDNWPFYKVIDHGHGWKVYEVPSA
jgi:hypothetical protein